MTTTAHKTPTAQEKNLNLKQREAAILLAQGTTIAATAKKIGVNEKTIDVWKHNEAFLEAVRQVEDEIYNESLSLLKRTTKAAIMTLVACMDAKVSDYVRVQAASKLLEQAMEVHSIKVLEERIAELEELAKAQEA